MSLVRIADRVKYLGWLLLFFLPAGCSPGTAKPVLPAAVAPVRPAAVRAETLPSVKYIEITKDAGITFTIILQPRVLRSTTPNTTEFGDVHFVH